MTSRRRRTGLGRSALVARTTGVCPVALQHLSIPSIHLIKWRQTAATEPQDTTARLTRRIFATRFHAHRTHIARLAQSPPATEQLLCCCGDRCAHSETTAACPAEHDCSRSSTVCTPPVARRVLRRVDHFCCCGELLGTGRECRECGTCSAPRWNNARSCCSAQLLASPHPLQGSLQLVVTRFRLLRGVADRTLVGHDQPVQGSAAPTIM